MEKEIPHFCPPKASIDVLFATIRGHLNPLFKTSKEKTVWVITSQDKTNSSRNSLINFITHIECYHSDTTDSIPSSSKFLKSTDNNCVIEEITCGTSRTDFDMTINRHVVEKLYYGFNGELIDEKIKMGSKPIPTSINS